MLDPELASAVDSGEGVVAGVLSGTSADGIDVGFVRLEGADAHGRRCPRLFAFRTEPFAEGLAARVRAVLDGAPCGLRETALLHRDLGLAFGRAVRRLADETALEPCVAGSHGQTVWHHDGAPAGARATLQLGDGDFVAEAAGCAVVSDFRQRDVAAGGEGAPLSALADDWIFAREPRPACVLNLGGMANVSVLAERTASFDTGPCGSLLDGLARRLAGRPFDAGGALAAAGTPDLAHVEATLAAPFFAAPPPKSTGRDTFGEAWVDAWLAAARRAGAARPADALATAVELVAGSVALALERFVAARPARVLVAGGGLHNAALVRALARRLPVEVVSSAAAGVDPDAREAIVFAVLAARAVLGLATTRNEVTGAAPGRVLGKLSAAPPARSRRKPRIV